MSGKKQILVVDDDTSVRNSVARLVFRALPREADVTVSMASSGEEALRSIRASSSSDWLLIIDFDLGTDRLDGLEVCRRLSQEDIQVTKTLHTSHTFDQAELEAVGVSCLIPKNSLDEVLRIIRVVNNFLVKI